MKSFLCFLILALTVVGCQEITREKGTRTIPIQKAVSVEGSSIKRIQTPEEAASRPILASPKAKEVFPHLKGKKVAQKASEEQEKTPVQKSSDLKRGIVGSILLLGLFIPFAWWFISSLVLERLDSKKTYILPHSPDDRSSPLSDLSEGRSESPRPSKTVVLLDSLSVNEKTEEQLELDLGK